jgi:hypothetical protein
LSSARASQTLVKILAQHAQACTGQTTSLLLHWRQKLLRWRTEFDAKTDHVAKLVGLYVKD